MVQASVRVNASSDVIKAKQPYSRSPVMPEAASRQLPEPHLLSRNGPEQKMCGPSIFPTSLQIHFILPSTEVGIRIRIQMSIYLFQARF